MKVFVGTLYSGENEFDECVAAIQSQTYRNFDHFVFKNLPNKEAHVTLFKSFLDKSDEYAILVKVDADMVLANDMVFENMVDKLQENPQIDLFAIAVHDFFTDKLIWGLNAYRNTVRWDFDKETIFVDIPNLPKEKVIFDDRSLAPAAFHCKNPSPFQSFHYGVHRGLKSIQPKGGSSHWNSLNQIRSNFRRKKEVRLGLAVLGAELAYAGGFTIADLDYTNPRMSDILKNYMSWDAVQVELKIKKLRWLNWGFLPNKIRRKILISRSSP